MEPKKQDIQGQLGFQKVGLYGTMVPRIPTSASDYFQLCVNEGEPIERSFFVVLETVEDYDLWTIGGEQFKSWTRILVDGRVGWVMSLFVEGQ